MNPSFLKPMTVNDKKDEVVHAITRYHTELMMLYERAMRENPDKPFTSGIMELYCQRATYSSDHEGNKKEQSHKNWLHMNIFEELTANKLICKRSILSKNGKRVLHNVYMLQEKPNHTDEMIIDDINQFKMALSFPKNNQTKEVIIKQIHCLNKLLSNLKPTINNVTRYDVLIRLILNTNNFSEMYLRTNYKINNSDIQKLEYILTSNNYTTRSDLNSEYYQESIKIMGSLKERYRNQIKNYYEILKIDYPETCIDNICVT